MDLMPQSLEAPTKICTLCGVTKPLTDFYQNIRTRDGLTHRCKPCHCLATKDSREKNPSKHQHTSTVRFDKRRTAKYLQKPALDLARQMAVLVNVVKAWRDHDPGKFTEFKKRFAERVK